MIKAVLFDLDMTLVNFMKFKKKASDAAAKAMVKAGLQMDPDKAKEELFSRYIKDIEGETIFQEFLKDHNAFSEKTLAAALNAYLITKYKFLKPYPKVKETLLKLKEKGLKLGIVTDAPKLKAYMRLDATGLVDLFDFVVGFEDTNEHKPSSLPFKKALEILNVDAADVLMVGDWPERDIKGAKEAGMKTCLARYGYDQHKQGEFVEADYEIKKIEDVLEVTEK